jgi:hypothetical protein
MARKRMWSRYRAYTALMCPALVCTQKIPKISQCSESLVFGKERFKARDKVLVVFCHSGIAPDIRTRIRVRRKYPGMHFTITRLHKPDP